MMLRISLLALFLLIAPVIASADEVPCGEVLLSFEGLPPFDWWIVGTDVAAGADGNYLSVSGRSIVLADSGGAVLFRTDFDDGVRPVRAAVSADEDGYLVFWTEQSHEPRSNLHVARVGLDGQVVDRGTLPIGEGRRAVDLDAAFDGTNHLLAWSSTDGIARGFLVRPDGALARPGFEIVESAPCSDLSVAASDQAFAVTASSRRTCEAPGMQVFESPLTLLFLDSHGGVLSSRLLEDEAKGGSVSRYRDEWVAVWGSYRGLEGRRFDPQGSPTGPVTLVIDELTAMEPEVGASDDGIFLLWSSDVVYDTSCGIDWDVAASRLDDNLQETERHILGDVFESHCPPSGYTGPFQPRGDVACSAGECLMVSGAMAAVADQETVLPLADPNPAAPLSFASLDRLGVGRYMAVYAIDGTIHVATVNEEGIIERERPVAELERVWGPIETVLNDDGRFALITATADGNALYGWTIDTRTLEVIRERFPVPRGAMAGGDGSFLIAWKGSESYEQILHLAIFGVDGEVRMSTEVMRGTFVSAAPAWLVDRFVVLGMSHNAISIFETGPGGGSVSAFPLPWRQRQMRGWGTAQGFLLVSTGAGEVLTIGRGGSWETGDLPAIAQGGSGSGDGAFYWDGSFWMRSWGISTFAEVDGSRALPLRGRFLEVRNDEIVTYTTEYGDRGLEVSLHRYGGNEDGIARVSFSRELYQLREWETTGSITLLRSGSARDSVEVRVEIVGDDHGALPFEIVDPVVRFAPGEIAKDLWVVVPQDQLYQDVDTRLRIVPLTSETVVECAGEAIVRVADDDHPVLVPDVVELTEGDERRVETLRLSIDGGFLRPTLIDFHLDSMWFYGVDRAVLGEDFEPLYVTVRVEPGQQVVDVPLVILGDKRYERTKSIVLRYWYGVDHIEIGADSSVVIELKDDDELSRRRAVRR